MTNPQIAIKGNCNVDYLTREFWKLTETTYKDYSNELDELSSIHINFIDLTTKRKAYSMGYDKQGTSKGTLYFNKINPPEIKELSTANTTNEIDDLPI